MANGRDAALTIRVAVLEGVVRQLLAILERHLMDQTLERTNLIRYQNEIKILKRTLNGG